MRHMTIRISWSWTLTEIRLARLKDNWPVDLVDLDPEGGDGEGGGQEDDGGDVGHHGAMGSSQGGGGESQ